MNTTMSGLKILAVSAAASLTLVAMTASAARNDCWMTGGGSIFATEYGGEQRITHGFVIHCTPRRSDNLQVNDHGTGWSFHLRNLTGAICINDPAIEPNPPDATFDTFVGQGTGICRNVAGQSRYCTAVWTFTDGGERGGCIRDTAIIEVLDESGNTLIAVSGEVDCGNHQAHSN